MSTAAMRFLVAFGDGCVEFYALPQHDLDFMAGRLNLCLDDDYYSVGREAGLSADQTDAAVQELVEAGFVRVAKETPAVQFNPKGSIWYAQRATAIQGNP